MTEYDTHDIEEKVKIAFTSSVPDVLDNVLSQCEKQNGRAIAMEETKSKNNIFKWAAGIAAAFVLVFTGVLGLYLYQTNNNVASVVSLDVNPSIEIKTNKNEKILEVNALNEDGKIVIGEMSFEGSSIEVTINALIGSMLRNGYLNDASNSILVSVYGENNERSSALQEKLTDEINSILETYNTFSGAVLSQTVIPDSDLQSLSDSYGISLGKARLIRQVIANKPQYSPEELAGLTINELNLMSEINGIALEDVLVVGNASDKAYIGINRAKEIAFSRAGISSDADVSKLEMEMDYEHGIMIYEISFDIGNYEYDYDIDAVTGEIIKEECEPDDDKGKTDDKDKTPSDNYPDNSEIDNSNSNSNISVDKAKEIAFSRAGVSSENDVSKLEIETDYENGVKIYEVSFRYNNYEYEYEIDASTGMITKEKRSPIDNKPSSGSSNNTNTNSSSNTNNNIDADRAKEIAFSRAGVSSESSVSKLEIETDYEHGVKIYEISFCYNNYEYEYEIDSSTGAITEEKRSSVDNKSPSGSSSSANTNSSSNTNSNISADRAKEIAFSHAGVSSESSVSKLEIETDYEHGVKIYEISFRCNNYEYEYEIDASTGVITESSHEKHSSDSSVKNPDLNSSDYIGEASAKEIALSHAKLNSGSITDYSCKTYIQQNTAVYKVKFDSKGYEYSYDINALTGEIVKYDMQPEHD